MNKIYSPAFIFFCMVIMPVMVEAQTFTMGKQCKELLGTAHTALASGLFQEALTNFESFSEECKTKDAKALGAVGKAEAYNGLGEYDKAIAEADAALKVTKDRSLAAHFQKSIALSKLGDADGAKASLNQVIALTENNQNTTERASNYALMADLYDRQLGERDSALMYLDQAMALDPDNTNFIIQQGDMYVASQEYNKAFAAYDQAVAQGRNDLEIYIIRSNAGLKMLENKYGTTRAKDLNEKMSLEEKTLVCGDVKKALDLGWNDMNKDMFSALVCK